MIKMLRIDERLIHGQVAVAWSKVLKITHIVLINDNVVKNEIQKMTLKMAVPDGVKLAIKSVKEGIELLHDPRTQIMQIMVVVSNPYDALAVAQNVEGIELINVGNYGLFPSKSKKPKRDLVTCVRVDEDEISVLKKISELGIPFEAQLTPDSSKKDMIKLLKGE
ncbi:PTS system mannose/fructose/N-acetylgalactosamine-transporter subunit IIB [Thermoanaerobacterium thermosaccharolyticum]|uniref:PTS system mannose/fructose/N-acetylgalactosamine-transporter subunit IIB n=1 Tax=Thermoanaerobacterium thermosaccharolyticum TaxID=1517 RepID=UPI0012385AC2|nr:PTS sugar transporter subunit IIB [Thermoanaerobacterium thermosaccharolyticum]KAA5806021.1 PTS sugar transporter subunit IIB [Thermoanaerobacterium thermosaccharolyticum]